jgi:hypothetical protein
LGDRKMGKTRKFDAEDDCDIHEIRRARREKKQDRRIRRERDKYIAEEPPEGLIPADLMDRYSN